MEAKQDILLIGAGFTATSILTGFLFSEPGKGPFNGETVVEVSGNKVIGRWDLGQ